jgi:hypothetical protein
MSFSGFPTGFSLDSTFGVDPNLSSFNPIGELEVGDFAPMAEGLFPSPLPSSYEPTVPQTGLEKFIGGVGQFAGDLSSFLYGVDDVVRAAQGMPPRMRYADGSRRQAGEGLGSFFDRNKEAVEQGRSSFQPSRPVQSESDNVSRDLQIFLPQRMASIFSDNLGSGSANFFQEVPSDVTRSVPRFR